MCLLALTRYMKLTGSNSQNTVTLNTEESEEVFTVDNDNRLVVQRSKLSRGHGQYTVAVEGEGCAFIQVMEALLRGRTELACKSSDPCSVTREVFCHFDSSYSYLYFPHIFIINSRKYKLCYVEFIPIFYSF